jgi:curved DNA-binding protein CbpA
LELQVQSIKKRDSHQWKIPKSSRQKESVNVKISGEKNHADLLFFDIEAIIHCEFHPLKQTINQTLYLQVLEILQQCINFAS